MLLLRCHNGGQSWQGRHDLQGRNLGCHNVIPNFKTKKTGRPILALRTVKKGIIIIIIIIINIIIIIIIINCTELLIYVEIGRPEKSEHRLAVSV